MGRSERGQLGLEDAYKRFIQRHIYRRKARRLHITTKKNLSLKTFNDTPQIVDHKPKGLWYGVGDGWMDWCLSEQPNWLCPYIYEVVLDESQLLAINDIPTFEKFEDEHQAEAEWEKRLREQEKLQDLLAPNPIMSGLQEAVELLAANSRINRRMRMFHNMNYPKVAETFGAMEITPYIWDKRLSSMWYYGWDCASGCVWNRKALKDLRLFASYDKASGEFVKVGLQPKKTKV